MQVPNHLSAAAETFQGFLLGLRHQQVRRTGLGHGAACRVDSGCEAASSSATGGVVGENVETASPSDLGAKNVLALTQHLL